MSLPILPIVNEATFKQLTAARQWTADHLHVPRTEVTSQVAVAYVVRHFKSGELEGWDGFVDDLG